MSAKHTPGPWNTGGSGWIGIRKEDRCIARLDDAGFATLSAEDRANARLIAAAPDLLAALKNLVGAYGGEPMSAEGSLDAYENAKAVIAKAEGGQE